MRTADMMSPVRLAKQDLSQVPSFEFCCCPRNLLVKYLQILPNYVSVHHQNLILLSQAKKLSSPNSELSCSQNQHFRCFDNLSNTKYSKSHLVGIKQVKKLQVKYQIYKTWLHLTKWHHLEICCTWPAPAVGCKGRWISMMSWAFFKKLIKQC